MHDLMNKQMKNNGWLWWIAKMISKYFLSKQWYWFYMFKLIVWKLPFEIWKYQYFAPNLMLMTPMLSSLTFSHLGFNATYNENFILG